MIEEFLPFHRFTRDSLSRWAVRAVQWRACTAEIRDNLSHAEIPLAVLPVMASCSPSRTSAGAGGSNGGNGGSRPVYCRIVRAAPRIGDRQEKLILQVQCAAIHSGDIGRRRREIIEEFLPFHQFTRDSLSRWAVRAVQWRACTAESVTIFARRNTFGGITCHGELFAIQNERRCRWQQRRKWRVEAGVLPDRPRCAPIGRSPGKADPSSAMRGDTQWRYWAPPPRLACLSEVRLSAWQRSRRAPNCRAHK